MQPAHTLRVVPRRVLSTHEAADYLNISAGHLRNMRSRGESPGTLGYSRHGSNKVRWDIDDLDAWLDGIKESSKS